MKPSVDELMVIFEWDMPSDRFSEHRKAREVVRGRVVDVVGSGFVRDMTFTLELEDGNRRDGVKGTALCLAADFRPGGARIESDETYNLLARWSDRGLDKRGCFKKSYHLNHRSTCGNPAKVKWDPSGFSEEDLTLAFNFGGADEALARAGEYFCGMHSPYGRINRESRKLTQHRARMDANDERRSAELADEAEEKRRLAAYQPLVEALRGVWNAPTGEMAEQIALDALVAVGDALLQRDADLLADARRRDLIAQYYNRRHQSPFVDDDDLVEQDAAVSS